MKKETIKRIISVPAVWRLCGARRVAMLLVILLTMTVQTAWATTENLGGYNFTVNTDTEGSYYVIDGTAALNALASYVNAGNDCSGKRFKMTAPITYNGSANNYTPIGNNSQSFSGTFDGQGNTISGININNTSATYQGIFGSVNNNKGTVKNLVVSNCSIVAYQKVGAIAGTIQGRGTIENCSVGSDVTLSGNSGIGGISGGNDGGTIKGCTCAATITGTTASSWNAYNLGGIAGSASDAGGPTPYLTANLFTGVINGNLNYNIGAIVGRNYNASLTNNFYTSTGFGGIGAESSTTGADGVGAAKAYELTAAPALLGAATFDYGAVKAYGNYGLGYNSKYYLALIPLSETEGVTYLTTNLASETAVPVEFKREFTADKSSTICLPFALTSAKAAAAGSFYGFVGVDKTDPANWVVTMQDTGNKVSSDLAANTPYLFKPDATGELTFDGTVDVTSMAAGTTPSTGNTDGWVFRGTFERIDWTTDPQYIYGFAIAGAGGPGEGVFFRVNGGTNSYALPFRAYLDGTAGTHALASRRGAEALPDMMTVRLIGADGNTTAIGTMDTKTGEVTFDGWFDLNGRRLQGKPSTKGIYIHNGRKEVLK